MKNNKTTPFDFDKTEAWATDSFYVMGILGFFLYVLLGLSSLPSVGSALSWREFTFIQVSVCVYDREFTFRAIDFTSHALAIRKISFHAFMKFQFWSSRVFISHLTGVRATRRWHSYPQSPVNELHNTDTQCESLANFSPGL